MNIKKTELGIIDMVEFFELSKYPADGIVLTNDDSMKITYT
jgi:hypothetical protein